MTRQLVSPTKLFAVIAAIILSASVLRAGTIRVYNTNDAFAGSLRQAIQDAAPGDTIVFQIPTNDPGYGYNSNSWTISLTSGALETSKNLTIDGAGSKIIVRRSGGPSFQIFKFPTGGGPVTLANLTLRDGTGDFGGVGGAISNSGTLTVRNCTLVNNTAVAVGSAISNSSGATLTMMNCTVTGNTAGGSAIDNFSGNLGSLTIINSTIYGNTGTARPCGGVANASGSTARIRNSIIAGNTAGASPNVEGNFISEGYNLIGSGSGGFGFTATGDQVGVGSVQVNLGTLADNGGLTQTLVPGSGSLAIDQGKSGLDANMQPINIDQRGSPRPVDMPGVNNAIGGDGSDIGAVELGLPQPGPTYTVTSTARHSNGGCTVDDCTLLEAINAANGNADANTINFAAGVQGTIDTLAIPAGLTITNPVTINGPGARLVRISGASFSRVFQSNANASISGLTITGGNVPGNGGGILVNTGVINLTDCSVTYNNAQTDTGNGGGIYLSSGATLNLVRTEVSNNYAQQFGGGIYSDGAITATNCTFFSNTAFRGGGIISRFNNGASSVTLRNSTITHNTATSTGTVTGDGGGGFYAEGSAPQYHLGNTLIAANVSQATPPTNPDVRGSLTSDGHNFIGTIGFSSLTSGVADQVGSNASPRNARLAAAAANNGGPTATFALLSDSTAINAGDNALASPTDQRGYPRVGVSDIGAFEFGSGLLQVTKIQRSGNDLDLAFTEAVAGSTYRFEQTYEIAPAAWQQIPSASDYTPTQTGAFEFIFPGAAALPPNQSKIFYRVRLLP